MQIGKQNFSKRKKSPHHGVVTLSSTQLFNGIFKNPIQLGPTSKIMMTPKIFNQNILEIASMRFQIIVAETMTNLPVTLELPVEPGVHGFIVLLQPSLPCIN